MKGRLILVDVKEPKEGLRVLYNKKVYSILRMPELWRIAGFCDLKREGASIYSNMTPLSQLRQIAVEYYFSLEPYSGFTKTLPLHSDYYEKALPLIGQEVQFEIDSYYLCQPNCGWSKEKRGNCDKCGKSFQIELNVAKLIPEFKGDIDVIGNCANCGVEFHIHKSTPTYTEEELIDFGKYLLLSNSDWWLKNSQYNKQKDWEKVVEDWNNNKKK